MTHEDTHRISRQEVPGETQKEAQATVSDEDFKPYLKAVNTASQRTRSTIYVLIAAMLLIITAFRNTFFPDWIDSRLSQLQLANACLQDNDLSSAECKKAIEYAKGFLFQGTLITKRYEGKDLLFKQEAEREIKEQINAFIRQRTDALSLHLPFFGIAIDTNDLGTVGGLILASILFVLYASLIREVDNLKKAKQKAEEIRDESNREDKFRANLELLLMPQLFGSPSKARMHIGRGVYVFFFLLPALHGCVLYIDIKTIEKAAILQGLKWALFETVVEVSAFALVVFFCVQCYKRQKELNRSLEGLAELIQPNTDPNVLYKEKWNKERIYNECFDKVKAVCIDAAREMKTIATADKEKARITDESEARVALCVYLISARLTKLDNSRTRVAIGHPTMRNRLAAWLAGGRTANDFFNAVDKQLVEDKVDSHTEGC